MERRINFYFDWFTHLSIVETPRIDNTYHWGDIWNFRNKPLFINDVNQLNATTNRFKKIADNIFPLQNGLPPQYFLDIFVNKKMNTYVYKEDYLMQPNTINFTMLQEVFNRTELKKSKDYEYKLVGDTVEKNCYNWYLINMIAQENLVYPDPLSNIPVQTIKFIKDNDIKIMLWLSWEPFHFHTMGHTLLRVVQFCEHHEIPISNVYLQNCNLKSDYYKYKLWDIWRHSDNKLDEIYINLEAILDINIRPTNFFHWELFTRLKQDFDREDYFTSTVCKEQYIKDAFLVKRNKKFFLPIRNVKSHRVLLLTALTKKGVIDDGYYSCIGIMEQILKVEDRNYLKKETVREIRDKCLSRVDYVESFDITKTDILRLLKKIPIFINEYEGFRDGVDIDDRSILPQVNDSYFTITFETVVGDDTNLFITEKSYKPFFYMQPFIIIGEPHTLAYLRTKGYETFPEFFDESYDEIIDKNDRFSFCTEQILKLCEKDIDELHEMYISVKDKLIHNRRLFLSQNPKKEVKTWFKY